MCEELVRIFHTFPTEFGQNITYPNRGRVGKRKRHTYVTTSFDYWYVFVTMGDELARIRHTCEELFYVTFTVQQSLINPWLLG